MIESMEHEEFRQNLNLAQPSGVNEPVAKLGQLKIFLGYAAGVGKTYAMLEAARQRQAEGKDVVVGFIETHDRVEAEMLVAGLEIIPRIAVASQANMSQEMDVDAILQRKPELVLVDDLSHTNPPGARHPRRYQDVEEFLSAGIHVYTTLNIQHLESLNDLVQQITGTVVQETIPDHLIDNAADIELVDLPPDELLRRLENGKVFIPQPAVKAIEHFYRKGNLTALREMAMRRAAERVDDQMRSYMQNRSIAGPWQVTERLVVCVGPDTLGEKLVRATKLLANELNAEWTVMYVELPEAVRLPQEKRDQITRTIHLAEELGAKSVILPAASAQAVADTILRYAQNNNVTKIIVGKPVRSVWQELLKVSIVDQLIRSSKNINIYVVAQDEEKPDRHWASPLFARRTVVNYTLSVVFVAVASIISGLIGKDISPANLVMVYLLAVVLAAIYLGRGPSILASILGVFVFDYFFVPPYLTLSIADTEYLITFAGLLLVGNVISLLTLRAQDQAEAARRREMDTYALYSLARDLSAAEDMGGVLTAIKTHIELTFGCSIIIHLAENDVLHIQKEKSRQPIDPTDTAAALWTFRRGEVAGQGTKTMHTAAYRYYPLVASGSKVGVLGVNFGANPAQFVQDHQKLLDALINQSAQAVERFQLSEKARQIKLLKTTEKLQTALLNSISHDLRTPLVSITGALSTLDEQKSFLGEKDRQVLIDTARGEADRLNRLVSNLLEMSRLESGALVVNQEYCDVQDLIGAALGQIEERLAGRKINVVVAPDLPLVPMDFVLIVHVLINLLDNALKYSSPSSPILIQAEIYHTEALISVLDQGIGIPPEDLFRVFDKFYRVHRAEQVSGTGLGLAISKGIIEAHNGRIWAENREGGGTRLTLALPLGTGDAYGE